MEDHHKINRDFFGHMCRETGFVYDINYNKEYTIFNQEAYWREIDHLKNVNGKYMLIRQAAESFKKWFNIDLNKNDIDEAVGLLKVKR